MITPTADVDARMWIQTICERWSASIGWPIDFAEANSTNTGMLPGPVENTVTISAGIRPMAPHTPGESGRPVVAERVVCGDKTLGELRLRTFHEAPADVDTRAARAVLKSLAELLSDVQQMREELAVREADASALLQLEHLKSDDEPLTTTIDRLLSTVCQLSEFRSAALFMLHPESKSLRLRREFHMEPRELTATKRQLLEAPDADVLLKRQPVTVLRPSGRTSHPWLPADCVLGVCLPVFSRQLPLGTLWVYDRRRRQIGLREGHLLESVACQIGEILERAALQAQRRSAFRLRADVNVAAENHPMGCYSQVPAQPDFDVAGFCSSEHELGGDLCELVPLQPGLTGIAIGDASGNGVAASLVMTAARGALHGYAARVRNSVALTKPKHAATVPRSVVQQINAALNIVAAPHQFMSFLFGVLNPRKLTFDYTNAGHPGPLLLRGEDVKELKSHGLLAGILEEQDYGTSLVQLQRGDSLIFFTDGITEAPGPSEEMFRSGGIVQAVRESQAGTAQGMVDAICRKLDIYTNGGSGDDRSLLVVRIP